MTLGPQLSRLAKKLDDKGYSLRTSAQDQLLIELKKLDPGLISGDTKLRKSVNESVLATRMTSPDSGTCACCGR